MVLVRADPYVRCDVDGVSKRTTVIKKSQNPRWETLLHLLVPDQNARIRVKVVDDQVLGINDKLGSFEFSAKHLTAPQLWYGASNRYRGLRAGHC